MFGVRGPTTQLQTTDYSHTLLTGLRKMGQTPNPDAVAIQITKLDCLIILMKRHYLDETSGYQSSPDNES